MNNPFHLSFTVPNLREAEAFYIDVLDCKKGRDTGNWIDVIFYGHQLTIHQESEKVPSQAIDHFGVTLGKEEWRAIFKKLQCLGIEFVLAPTKSSDGSKSESGKFIIKDPAQNLIEFKFYKCHSTP